MVWIVHAAACLVAVKKNRDRLHSNYPSTKQSSQKPCNLNITSGVEKSEVRLFGKTKPFGKVRPFQSSPPALLFLNVCVSSPFFLSPPSFIPFFGFFRLSPPFFFFFIPFFSQPVVKKEDFYGNDERGQSTELVCPIGESLISSSCSNGPSGLGRGTNTVRTVGPSRSMNDSWVALLLLAIQKTSRMFDFAVGGFQTEFSRGLQHQ